MLIEAKTSLDIKQDRRLERIQQKVLNMGPLAKLWFGIEEFKSLGKLAQMIIENLARAVGQTAALVDQASQVVMYQRTQENLTQC